MSKKRVIGFILVIIAIAILISNVAITGAVIGTNTSNSLSLIAVILLVVGLILMSRRDRNYAQESLDNGRYTSNTRELKRMARKMGYDLVESNREGTKVYKGRNVITIIPNHRNVEGRGTVKRILEALASGESTFKRGHAH